MCLHGMCFIIFNIQMIPALTALRTLLRSAAMMILRGVRLRWTVLYIPTIFFSILNLKYNIS